MVTQEHHTPTTRGNWTDLTTVGYVHVRNFLSSNELRFVQREYLRHRGEHLHQRDWSEKDASYNVTPISPIVNWHLEGKLRGVGQEVRAATGITADLNTSGVYFDTGAGIDLDWHQDHESYFTYQQNYNYLNYYIAVLKPDATRTNLCVVPWTRMKSALPAEQYAKLPGGGARRFIPRQSATVVYDDEIGEELLLPVDIEELKDTPELEEGDLLLLRGDVIHRTQDTETDRVAMSYRWTCASATVSRLRLQSGSEEKRRMIQNNPEAYGPIFECFQQSQRDEVTARELLDFYRSKYAAAAKGG
jgi:hypothetical protein